MMNSSQPLQKTGAGQRLSFSWIIDVTKWYSMIDVITFAGYICMPILNRHDWPCRDSADAESYLSFIRRIGGID